MDACQPSLSDHDSSEHCPLPDHTHILSYAQSCPSQEGGQRCGRAKKPHRRARYNYGGVLSVYLADTVETCLAEKMFYFHRETIRRLDALHLPLSPGVPLFSATFTLWEIRLKKAIPGI
jgi:hypothetical protein